MKLFPRILAALAAVLFVLSWIAGCQSTLATTADRALPAPNREIDYASGTTRAEVVVAGGCFWCTEAVFEEIQGVTDVTSGYAGGSESTAKYQEVARGRTKHAESIRIAFDPREISFGKIMQIFFTMHHPTQANGQGPDIGKQYRSAVFYSNEQQKEVVAAYIRQLDESGEFDKPIATTLEPLDAFYPAEDYHQNYVKHNPRDRYVVQWALPKIAKVKKLFPEEMKGGKPDFSEKSASPAAEAASPGI